MAHKALAAEDPVSRDLVIGKHQIVISEGLVNSGTADLDDLKSRRGFQHAVADLWRLQDTVPGVHHKGRSLIFIDHAHPSGFAEDHLEADAMIVHVVRDLTAF